MTATTSFFSTCCALASGNSSLVTTFSSTPPKFNFAMMISLLVCFILHCKYFLLLVQEFVLDDVLAGLGQLELSQLLMETMAGLDDGHPGAAHEFDQPVWFQYFYQPIRLFPLSRGLEYRIVLADHYGPGAVF